METKKRKKKYSENVQTPKQSNFLQLKSNIWQQHNVREQEPALPAPLASRSAAELSSAGGDTGGDVTSMLIIPPSTVSPDNMTTSNYDSSTPAL